MRGRLPRIPALDRGRTSGPDRLLHLDRRSRPSWEPKSFRGRAMTRTTRPNGYRVHHAGLGKSALNSSKRRRSTHLPRVQTRNSSRCEVRDRTPLAKPAIATSTMLRLPRKTAERRRRLRATSSQAFRSNSRSRGRCTLRRCMKCQELLLKSDLVLRQRERSSAPASIGQWAGSARTARRAAARIYDAGGAVEFMSISDHVCVVRSTRFWDHLARIKVPDDFVLSRMGLVDCCARRNTLLLIAQEPRRDAA